MPELYIHTAGGEVEKIFVELDCDHRSVAEYSRIGSHRVIESHDRTLTVLVPLEEAEDFAIN
jgi:hypothetical protein